MKNKGFWIVFIAYILLFIADFVTTLSLGEVSTILESNPVFRYIGFPGIIILNLGIIWLLGWLYTRHSSTPNSRFLIFNLMGMIIIARIFAIKNALYWLNNPITIEKAQILATETAKTQSLMIMFFLGFLPYIYALIVWFFFTLDHYIEKK